MSYVFPPAASSLASVLASTVAPLTGLAEIRATAFSSLPYDCGRIINTFIFPCHPDAVAFVRETHVALSKERPAEPFPHFVETGGMLSQFFLNRIYGEDLGQSWGTSRGVTSALRRAW